MLLVAFRGLASRKLRSVLTALAIVLGVALVGGTYVLTDSITGAFNSIFQTVYRGTDATVTGRNAIDTGANNGARVETFSGDATGFDIWGNTLIAPTASAPKPPNASVRNSRRLRVMRMCSGILFS